MTDIITHIFVEGSSRLALRFPTGALKGAGAAPAAMNEEGFIVRRGESPSSLGSWRFDNVEKEGEGALLLGPDFAGKSPDDAQGLEEGMPLLLSLARAFLRLQAAGRLPRGIISSGILISEVDVDADVLVLPPTAVARALSARGSEARAAAVARLTSPRAKSPEADASFLIAQAVYRYATGKASFEREAAEPGNLAGSARYSTAIGLAAPRLNRGIADLADRALDDPESVSLPSWIEVLEAAEAKHWTREISAEEETELERRRRAVEAESRSKRKRADFFRRRGGLLIAAAVLVVVGAFVAGDMIRAQRDKPDFSKLPPADVVRHYYTALDGLDMESLEACGDKKAFDADWNYVMTMTVVTKTRTAYEGKDPIIRAKDWLAAGKPALEQAAFLYGLVDLAITDEGGNGAVGSGTAGSEERFRATYSVWSMDRKDDPSGDPSKVTAFAAQEEPSTPARTRLIAPRGARATCSPARDRG